MDRININNLFAKNNDDFKELDVYSLYNPRMNREENKVNFNIQRLIKLREERKKKIYIQYEKIYKMCLNKINTANNMNKLDLVYEIPESIFGHYDYNKMTCLEYIEYKLKKLFIDTCIVTDNSIYISWLNLEKNMNSNKNEKNTNNSESDKK